MLKRGVHWRGVSNTNFTLYVLEEAFMARGGVLEGASITSFTGSAFVNIRRKALSPVMIFTQGRTVFCFYITLR